MAQICRTRVPKVPPFEPQGAPRRPLKRRLDVHWDLLASKNMEKEYHYFHKATDLIFWTLLGTIVAV